MARTPEDLSERRRLLPDAGEVAHGRTGSEVSCPVPPREPNRSEIRALEYRPAKCGRALLAEVHRVFYLRTQIVLMSITVLSASGLGLAKALPLAPGASVAPVLTAGAEISPFFVGLAATLFCASDLTSGQFAISLLQVRSRVMIFFAKLVVLVSVALGSAVVVEFVLAVVLELRGLESTSSGWGALAALPVLHVLFALLGAGIGTAIRSVVGAVSAYLALIWAFPVAVALVGIWLPEPSAIALQIAPITLTAGLIEADRCVAAAKFFVLDAVLLASASIALQRWSVR